MPAIAYAPRTPLHSIGYGGRDIAPFFTHRVDAPEVPLHSLGYMGAGAQAGAAITKAGAPIAGSITSSVASSAGWGAWAGPVGAGVAVGVGLIAGLLAAHALRAKQAKDENSAVNIGVSGFDSDLKKIQQAFSLGQVDASTAMQAAQLALSNYWQLVTPHIQPGRNGCAGGAVCASNRRSPNYCSGNIGAACCVGCADLNDSIMGPNGVIAAIQGQSTASEGPNVAEILKVYPSKYGAVAREAYTLTFTPPAPVIPSGSDAVSAIEQSFGIGTGAPSAGGSSSMLPWLLVAAGAFLVLR